jgi:hypothetical protein
MNRFIVAIALLCLSFPVTAQKQLRIIVPFWWRTVPAPEATSPRAAVARRDLDGALVAPPGTPRALAGRQSTAVARVLEDTELRRRLTELQAEPVGNTPEQMADIIRQDTERWSRVIQAANIRID